MVRLEEDDENTQIREELKDKSPQERQACGKALLGLFLAEKHFSPAGHPLSTFQLKNKEILPLFTLEEGDLVSLFVHGVSADAIPTGTVYEKSKESITVAMNAPWPEWFESDATYELHRSINRVTYRRMLEALDEVYQTQNTRLACFRDISLKQKKPMFDKVSVSKIQWLDTHLNASQKEAVACALSAKDVALVHGPPGTGKTTVLIEIIRQHLLKKQSIFVTAPSNTACDNILERLVARGINALRLGHPARITTSLREHTLDFKLALHPVARAIQQREAELFRLYKKEDRYQGRRSPGRDAEQEVRREISFIKQELKSMKKEVLERVLKEAQVVVATPAGIQDRTIRDKVFDVVVLDEATQATEPVSWIPLSRANKVIMAGDHFQLSPTVRSKAAEERGLGVSLFERFYEILPEESRVMLVQQYRMNEKIMGFSSREFYSGKLFADASVKSHTLAEFAGVQKIEETQEPFLYVDTAGKGFEEKLEEGSESRYNPQEAGVVLQILEKMLALGVPPEEIAVISAYSAQVRLLASRSPNPKIEIDSVDGFQGREKELVIVSLVRSNLTGEMGFLADTRRMNVAMTRAKRKLVVVGESSTLSSLKFYKDFIQYSEEVGGHKSIWEMDL